MNGSERHAIAAAAALLADERLTPEVPGLPERCETAMEWSTRCVGPGAHSLLVTASAVRLRVLQRRRDPRAVNAVADLVAALAAVPARHRRRAQLDQLIETARSLILHGGASQARALMREAVHTTTPDPVRPDARQRIDGQIWLMIATLYSGGVLPATGTLPADLDELGTEDLHALCLRIPAGREAARLAAMGPGTVAALRTQRATLHDMEWYHARLALMVVEVWALTARGDDRRRRRAESALVRCFGDDSDIAARWALDTLRLNRVSASV